MPAPIAIRTGRGLKSTFKTSRSDSMISVNDRLPHEGDRVIVVCNNFRCLGYLAPNRIWRDDFRDKDLHDVIGWMEV